jgi:DNA-directed RNA polymerase subunit RPC12/RpoP
MPIQFRCKSCQQLLGIARRKAGKVVDCPTCGKKTLVPKVDPLEDAATAPIPPQIPIPPVRRQVGKPVSIFDRVDVEKLLQPPRKPELVEESETALAVAEPPRKVINVPDPLVEAPAEEPKALTPLEQPEDEPRDDEPFALLAQVPASTTVRKSASNLQLALLGLAMVVGTVGAFFAGHWLGRHQPLF